MIFLILLVLLASNLVSRSIGGVGVDLFVKDCECGLSKNGGDLVIENGIQYAGDHSWPWMVSIVNMSESPPVDYCGGSLINNRFIMTAAHCIPDMNETGIENFKIYIGTNYINQHGSSFIERGIQEIITHPMFSFDTAEYDISLIELTEPIKFTHHNYVRPICLWDNEFELVGEKGVITGWGSFNLTEPTEQRLKEAQVEIVSTKSCMEKYATVDIPVVEETMLCAKALPGMDPCKGDSGGPLVIKTKNRYVQVGIISHGQGCSIKDFPSIYSRVSYFKDWVMNVTANALYCNK